MEEDKRQFKRFPADLMVMYEIINFADLGDQSLHKSRTPILEDLSLGGMLVVTSQNLPIDTRLKISMASFSVSAPVEIIGKVAWCGAGSGNDSVKLGISFEEQEESDRMLLEQILDLIENE
jgi:hypothetical protein